LKTEPVECCARYLRREFGPLSLERLVVVGKGSFEIARRKPNIDFDPVVVSLPFGSQRNVEGYMSGLKEHLLY
jgi:hypothetical protein